MNFIAGIELDDVNGIADGSNDALINKQQRLTSIAASVFNGVLSSAVNSSSAIFLTFVFQQSGDLRRVIIKAGSTQDEQIYNYYSTIITHMQYGDINFPTRE